MNIFILDRDPVIAAQMYCDTHVTKIILESAQMLGLAHWVTNPKGTPSQIYNATTHRHNHVSVWVRTTLANYRWTIAHANALLAEYTKRYGKIHKTAAIIFWLEENEPAIPDGPLTEFRQAVAEDCKCADVVEAYRNYYIRYKAHLAKWNHSEPPDWFPK